MEEVVKSCCPWILNFKNGYSCFFLLLPKLFSSNENVVSFSFRRDRVGGCVSGLNLVHNAQPILHGLQCFKGKLKAFEHY